MLIDLTRVGDDNLTLSELEVKYGLGLNYFNNDQYFKGETGISAYKAAKNGSFIGTEDEFNLSLANISTNVINVKHFGAKGDDFTDDTDAIQYCFDLVSDGECIFFPKGTYLVRELTLSQKYVVNIWGNGSILKKIPGNNSPAITVEKCSLVKISDISINGNRAPQYEVIDDNADKRDGIVLKGSSFCTIENCRIFYCKHDGLKVIGFYEGETFFNSDECHIINNFIQSNGQDGLFIDSVCDLNIQGNNIEFNTNRGCWMGSNTGIGSCNNIISSNNFISNEDKGLDIQSCSRICYSNNQIRNNGTRGLNIIGGKEHVIKGNNIHMNGRLAPYSFGICVGYNSDIIVSENCITNSDFDMTQGYGIALYTVSRMRIKNNVIKNNLQNGVSISEDSTDITIRDNIGVVDQDPNYKFLRKRISKVLDEPVSVFSYDIGDDGLPLNGVSGQIRIYVPAGCSAPVGASASFHIRINDISTGYYDIGNSNDNTHSIEIGSVRNVWGEVITDLYIMGNSSLALKSEYAFTDGVTRFAEISRKGGHDNIGIAITKLFLFTYIYTLPAGTIFEYWEVA